MPLAKLFAKRWLIDHIACDRRWCSHRPGWHSAVHHPQSPHHQHAYCHLCRPRLGPHDSAHSVSRSVPPGSRVAFLCGVSHFSMCLHGMAICPSPCDCTFTSRSVATGWRQCLPADSGSVLIGRVILEHAGLPRRPKDTLCRPSPGMWTRLWAAPWQQARMAAPCTTAACPLR